jgi:hypothetical protein
MDEYERLVIECALNRNDWCRADTARELDVDPAWLWKLMTKHNLVKLAFPGQKYRTKKHLARGIGVDIKIKELKQGRRVRSATPLRQETDHGQGLPIEAQGPEGVRQGPAGGPAGPGPESLPEPDPGRPVAPGVPQHPEGPGRHGGRPSPGVQGLPRQP